MCYNNVILSHRNLYLYLKQLRERKWLSKNTARSINRIDTKCHKKRRFLTQQLILRKTCSTTLNGRETMILDPNNYTVLISSQDRSVLDNVYYL